MKLGFVSAILDTWNYEEMMDFASDHGRERLREDMQESLISM